MFETLLWHHLEMARDTFVGRLDIGHPYYGVGQFYQLPRRGAAASYKAGYTWAFGGRYILDVDGCVVLGGSFYLLVNRDVLEFIRDAGQGNKQFVFNRHWFEQKVAAGNPGCISGLVRVPVDTVVCGADVVVAVRVVGLQDLLQRGRGRIILVDPNNLDG
jgi:hypothetical protein